MKLFPTIAIAWKSFASRKARLPLIVLIDLLFIYGLTRLHYEVFNRASVYAIKLTAMLGEQVQSLGEDAVPAIDVLQSADFTAAYHALLRYIAIFFACAFLIWLICKGTAWFLAHKTALKKANIRTFALPFLGATLFWTVAFLGMVFLALTILNYALFGTFALIGATVANALIILLYWVLAYFVFISYAHAQPAVKNAFVIGAKHWRELLPVHVITSLILFVATTVPTSLIKLNVYLPLAFVVFVALPGIAWARVLWVTAVQQVIKNA
jgi:hypothetical protein